MQFQILLLVGWIKLSTTLRRDDWVILPNVKPDGVDYTETPFWDYRKNLLYFLAPSSGMIYSLDPAINKTQKVKVDIDATFIQPSENPDCIVYGVENKIKTVDWDGNSRKTSRKTLAMITDGGSDAKIIAGAVSYEGNLTFIVKGKHGGSDVYSVYTMMLDKAPFKLSFYNSFCKIIDSLFWTCMPPYLYITSSVNRSTFQCNVQAGTIYVSHVRSWAKELYFPVGESKQDTTGLWYQLMSSSNNANSDVTQVDDKFNHMNYFVSPVKRLTSSAWGGAANDVFYLTTQKWEQDTEASAGGLFSCSTIGATGRPAFIAISSMNQGVNYCDIPRPKLMVPAKARPTKPEKSKSGGSDVEEKSSPRADGFGGFGGPGFGGFGGLGFGGGGFGGFGGR